MVSILRLLGLDAADGQERSLFFISIGLVAALAIAGIIVPDTLNGAMNAAFDYVLQYFGWWFMLATFVLAIVMTWLAVSKYSQVTIGGTDAEPDFSLFSWFAMVFTVSFGSVVIFWGVAEPISIVSNPPEPNPVPGTSTEVLSLVFMFIHNILPGLIAWYLPVALAFGLIVWDQDEYKISSMLRPVLDPERYKKVYYITDLAALIAIIGGLATTLGFTGSQLATTFANVFGAESAGLTYVLFAIIGAIFFVDVWLGLRDGIRNMARLTIGLIIILFSLLLVTGPGIFMIELGVEATGVWLDNIIHLTMYTAPVEGLNGGNWPQEWSAFWFAWWCAWGIFVGSFIARISKGRTLREVTGGLVVVPTIFLIAQHSILAGWALQPGWQEPISEALATGGNPAALTAAINLSQYSLVLGFLFAIVLTGYVITSLDSAAYILSSITLGEEEPNAYNRAIWGIVLALFGIMTLELPGTRAIESFSAVLALPFTIFFFVIVYATIVVAKEQYYENVERIERRLDGDQSSSQRSTATDD